MKVCGYCGLECEGYAMIDGTWFHHGEDDDPFSCAPPPPSCYEKAQWEAHGEESLLDYIMNEANKT